MLGEGKWTCPPTGVGDCQRRCTGHVPALGPGTGPNPICGPKMGGIWSLRRNWAFMSLKNVVLQRPTEYSSNELLQLEEKQFKTFGSKFQMMTALQCWVFGLLPPHQAVWPLFSLVSSLYLMLGYLISQATLCYHVWFHFPFYTISYFILKNTSILPPLVFMSPRCGCFATFDFFGVRVWVLHVRLISTCCPLTDAV